MTNASLRRRQKLGKYRIDGKLGEGGFASVYKATDTIEGVRVALKVLHEQYVTNDVLEEFRNEARVAARLKHPNIMPLKNADFIDGRFVLAYPLGDRTLSDRLQSRMSVAVAIDYADKMLSAVAYAHQQRVIHCDIKPDNMILFSDGGLMLGDFGLAKIANHTIVASGSGTLGYCAPEQAMGKPSFRSDVFSLGLVIYRMLSGQLPGWPFDWPPPGHERFRGRVHPELVALVRRSILVDPRRRFLNAVAMQRAFGRVKVQALKYGGQQTTTKPTTGVPADWKTVRRRQFQREFGKLLEAHYSCSRCNGPVAESMGCCPWCGDERERHDGTTRFPIQCPRCNRGLKQDWLYCPWCFGGGFEVATHREYADSRYVGRCTNSACTRKLLMPFMVYCPWCRRRVRRKWKIEGSDDTCKRCGWGVLGEFWNFCPWCSRSLQRV